MRWQRGVRLVVAIVGVGTAIALYVMTRNRPVNPHANASGTADPTATVLSVAMLLDHLGLPQAAARVEAAVAADLADRAGAARVRSTAEVGQDLVSRIVG